MKASQMIKQLEGLIQKHGDLPLALLEGDLDSGYCFVECEGVEDFIELQSYEVLYDANDDVSSYRKLFLID